MNRRSWILEPLASSFSAGTARLGLFRSFTNANGPRTMRGPLVVVELIEPHRRPGEAVDLEQLGGDAAEPCDASRDPEIRRWHLKRPKVIA